MYLLRQQSDRDIREADRGRCGGKKGGATFLLAPDLELPTALQGLPYKDNHSDEEEVRDGDNDFNFI